MQGAFPLPPERDPNQGPLKTSGTATLALASGVLSFLCLWGVGGVLAIVIGWLAHGEIERAEGRLSGKGLASAGIGLGIANVVASVVLLAFGAPWSQTNTGEGIIRSIMCLSGFGVLSFALGWVPLQFGLQRVKGFEV